MKAIIEEQGNGFPSAGDYVSSSDQLYRVESIDSRIQTEQFRSNYVYATVEPLDWSECAEGDEFPARVSLDA